MPGPNDLLARHPKEKLQQTPVQVWIAHVTRRFGSQGAAGQLAAQAVQGGEIVLNTWQSAEQPPAVVISAQCCSIAFDEFRMEPDCGLFVFRNTNQHLRDEAPQGIEEQMDPRPSLSQRPTL